VGRRSVSNANAGASGLSDLDRTAIPDLAFGMFRIQLGGPAASKIEIINFNRS